MADLSKVSKATEWPKLRQTIEKSVKTVLGRFPQQHIELQVKVMDETQFNGYVRRRINYFVDEWQRVSAWLFVPEEREEVPAILCCHQAAPQGKDEPAGVSGSTRLAFAQHYAELGYVTLAPDCITAGERATPGLDALDTREHQRNSPEISPLGKMLFDHIRAVDALADTKAVDPARIGVIGHGLGGTNALLLTAFDERVQACVASCGFTRFSDDPNPERWTSENGAAYLPKLKSALKSKKFPFDWEHILALAAPSPILLITALNDTVFPKTTSCQKAANQAKRIYKLLGAGNALENFTHRDGHEVTATALQLADEWMERWL